MHSNARVLHMAVLAGLAVLSAPALAGKSNPAATLRANDLLASHGALAQRATDDAFAVRDIVVDNDGTEHVRFDRTFRGLPVIGGDVVVHSRNGQLKSAPLGASHPRTPPAARHAQRRRGHPRRRRRLHGSSRTSAARAW